MNIDPPGQYFPQYKHHFTLSFVGDRYIASGIHHVCHAAWFLREVYLQLEMESEFRDLSCNRVIPVTTEIRMQATNIIGKVKVHLVVNGH
jgi:hypothetical protein